MPERAMGLLIGFVADRLLGDPVRWHPVAGFGAMVRALERRVYADSVARGSLLWAVAVVVPTLAAAAARAERRRTSVAATAVVTWTVLGGQGLRTAATRVGDALAGRDLDSARSELPWLCGRDPSRLDEAELARATVESLAENTADAVVAPLLWGAAFGLPGLVGYRCVNTLDAMVGHRSPRYHRFGRVAARADDLANLVPARVTAALICVAAGRGAPRAMATWRRDGHRHPSPNAGQCEAALAGALGVRLGGTNRYPEGVLEHRPTLGAGRRPTAADVGAAVALTDRVQALALLAAVVAAVGAAAVTGGRCR